MIKWKREGDSVVWGQLLGNLDVGRGSQFPNSEGASSDMQGENLPNFEKSHFKTKDF